MAAIIMCLVAKVADGTTIICSDNTQIRIAGLEVGGLIPLKGRAVLNRLVVRKTLSCLPAGNEGAFVVAKCTLPDKRDLACVLIGSGAAVRSDIAWRRYGLQDC